MSAHTIPFTYRDGPMLGVESMVLQCRPEDLNLAPTLHKCSTRPKGQAVFATAQGLYRYTRHESGQVWAVHVPGDQDRNFTDPPPQPSPSKERPKPNPPMRRPVKA